MSRSPTTADTRPRYPDSRPASGWADYSSASESPHLRGKADQTAEPQGSTRGTGPNPNATGPAMRAPYDAVASKFGGRMEGDSGGFSQDCNDYQCLDCYQEPAPKAY